MEKILNGRLIFVGIMTVLCAWFTWPSARYFNFIAGMDSPPTQEQKDQRNELIKSASMMKLGLDLQGGVDFLIAVDTAKLLEQKTAEVADRLRADFQVENVDATVAMNEDRTALTVKINRDKDTKIAREIVEELLGERTVEADDLSLLDGGTVTLTRSSDDVAAIERDAYDAAFKKIRSRVDEFGLTQPIVVKQPPNRIRVQIPGETDPKRIREGLLRTANLEFRLLHPEHASEIAKFGKADPAAAAVGTMLVKDELLEEVASEEVDGAKIKRLKRDIPGVPAGFRLYLGETKNTAKDGKIETVSNLIYLLKDKPELTGASLTRAASYTDPNDLRNPYKVTLEFNAEGTDAFARVTRENVGKPFAIMLDDVVVSSPNINEPILYGRCEITGKYTNEEATDLALVLKAGSLPAPLRVVNEQIVGASLGADSVVDSGKALIIGGLFVIVFMIAIYRAAGVIAAMAMFLNVLMIMAIQSMADATLTLSGIGGILLTMGMAVDANMLIYERLREELDAGKPIRAAINTAFGKAFSVILDSNITTLLPALILILFEIVEGSVKGFWTAMAIGLIANLYTGLTVTRALVDSWVAKRKTFNVGTLRIFKQPRFDFMSPTLIKLGIGTSVGIIALSFVYFGIHGVNPGVDFTGGVTASVRVADESIQRDDIERALKTEFKEARVVQILNVANTFEATVPMPEDSDDLEAIRAQVTNLFAESFAGKATISQMQSVDPVVGSEFLWTALLTILISSVVILGYVALRFEFAYGLGAVVALIHDVCMALGIFVMTGHSVTLDIVSALLVILGYSVNDTIVIFDRVRENTTEMYGKPIREIINASINQCLTRTIFTSTTTIGAVLAMLLFGGIGLKDFALVLLIGMISGIYSTIYMASAVVYAVLSAKERREGAAKAHGKTKTVKITATTAS